MNTTTNDGLTEKQRNAKEQAEGAYLRAIYRGWSEKKALKCAKEAYDTWMQD